MASILWLTDRSRFERGTQFCPFARFQEYHAGPYGYGFSRKALSVPLATGIYVDRGLSSVCQWIIDARKSSGTQPTHATYEVITWAAELAVEQYHAVIAKRGVLTLAADDPDTLARLNLLVAEQSCLIEGLIWAWCLVRLPQILEAYELTDSQTEEMHVLDCTCGIGSGIGELADHEARDCTGIGLQSKPDCLARRRSDGTYAYIEFKTTSQAKRAWAEGYERKQQLIIGILGAERRYGINISHVWVEGLVKGARKEDYPYGEGKPKRQQSFLCYGYYRAPGGPGSVPEWHPEFNWYDTEGLKNSPGKGKDAPRRISLWDAPPDAFPDPSISRMAWWIQHWAVHAPMTVAKCLHAIGPIPKRTDMIDSVVRSFIAEERLWQDRLWQVYDWSLANGKHWADPEYQAFVETVIPRSYNCDPFGPDHPCSFQPLCFKQEGWQDPIASGLFVYRAPHHQSEEDQMRARGLKPDHGMAEEEGEIDVEET